MSRCLRGVIVCWLLVCLCGSAAAQTKPTGISVEHLPLSPVTRSGGPVAVDWTITWHRPGLKRGRLAYTLRDDRALTEGPGYVHAEFVSDEIVLSSEAPYTFRTMIPATEPPFAPTSLQPILALEADLRFVTAGEVLELGQRPIRVPVAMRRSLALCVCDVWDVRNERDITATQAFVEFDRSLHFERFDSDRDVQSIITATAHVVPEDMPARPLELCSFDVVAIAAEGLPGLDGKQMTALVQWVDAGGSLLVMPGAGLEPSHVRFLNELIKAGPDQPPFALGKGGGLDDASPGETPVLVRKSLGRVAVVRADETPIDYDSDAWRRLVWFLWKYRQEHLAAILLDGEWADQAPNTVQAGQPWRPRAASGAWLLDRLLPESVAVVPLTTIAIILGLYVVVVGPVDYFVLGWLRLRKLTWIVFPIVTLAFAGYLVW
ncbi:MAG: hypothetical protein ACREIV_04605, partial [Planctomycetaceae bacterium]